ncbi:GIY-YIG nuclease family protein [Gilvibacter sp.]|jgi:putative endonuclease|uniref:GIY-YIG nuclease family protein n=1 Tax=Gilvibacter sp. TaxID=2729997 RepID=UPI003B52BC90
MMGYTYLLLCSDQTLYTGSTINIEQRVQLHNQGKAANHTKKRRPVKLIYLEEFDSIATAFEREKQIQNWSRRKKLALINSEFNQLKEYSKKSF